MMYKNSINKYRKVFLGECSAEEFATWEFDEKGFSVGKFDKGGGVSVGEFSAVEFS